MQLLLHFFLNDFDYELIRQKRRRCGDPPCTVADPREQGVGTPF